MIGEIYGKYFKKYCLFQNKYITLYGYIKKSPTEVRRGKIKSSAYSLIVKNDSLVSATKVR